MCNYIGYTKESVDFYVGTLCCIPTKDTYTHKTYIFLTKQDILIKV